MLNRGDDKYFTLWSLIVQARDVLFRARDSELSRVGITSVEARALFFVNLIGEQATPAMISRWMLREHNTTMALLNRMLKKGLITKTKDPDKKNSWLIALTEKGKEAYEYSLERKILEDIFSVLTEEERDATTEGLQKLCDQTFAYLKENPPTSL